MAESMESASPPAPSRAARHRRTYAFDLNWAQRLQSRITSLAVGIVVPVLVLTGGVSLLAAPRASASTSVSLVGTFRLTGGTCDPVSHVVSGSYFRLIFPHGNDANGPYFENSTSYCVDKSYTTIDSGTAGGLATGTYQPGSGRRFTRDGDARSNVIIRPVAFAAVDLALSTQPIDLQTHRSVPAPTITDNGGKLTGNLSALSAAWRGTFINQGSPKPGGGYVRSTSPVRGVYNVQTRKFVLSWTSSISGGPFSGFTGYWRLTGRFYPAGSFVPKSVGSTGTASAACITNDPKNLFEEWHRASTGDTDQLCPGTGGLVGWRCRSQLRRVRCDLRDLRVFQFNEGTTPLYRYDIGYRRARANAVMVR